MFYNKNLISFLNKKHIFLTGGTGFFGKSFLSFLTKLKRNNPEFYIYITILSRTPKKTLFHSNSMIRSLYNQPWIHFHEGDVTEDSFFSILQKTSFDFIFHFATASDSNLNDQHPEKMFEVIIKGTENILRFSKLQGNIDILFTSSGAVYGHYPLLKSSSPIKEELYSYTTQNSSLALIKSGYVEGKRQAEFIGISHAQKLGIKFLIARCFSYIGPFLDLQSHFAVSQFTKCALEQRDIILNSSGNSLRSYMDTDDLIFSLVSILQFGQSCYPYNVGSDEIISIKDLALKCSKYSKKNIQVLIPEQKNESCSENKKINSFNQLESFYVPDITRLRSILPDLKLTSIEKALALYIEYQLKNS